MNGEEGCLGRAYGHVVTGGDRGTSYELAYMGKFAWENSVASPTMQDKAIVMGMDDSGAADSQVYMYVGQKLLGGNAVQQAGLAGGNLYGVRVASANQTEDTLTEFGLGKNGSAGFSMTLLGDVSAKDAPTLDADSQAAGISNFNRIEDGAWDPTKPNRYYFVTTASSTTRSRLWSLTFTDIANPEVGGAIRLEQDGTEGQIMMDNLTVDSDGTLVIQEDPGNYAGLARVWHFDPASEKLTQVAEFDPALFHPRPCRGWRRLHARSGPARFQIVVQPPALHVPDETPLLHQALGQDEGLRTHVVEPREIEADFLFQRRAEVLEDERLLAVRVMAYVLGDAFDDVGHGLRPYQCSARSRALFLR